MINVRVIRLRSIAKVAIAVAVIIFLFKFIHIRPEFTEDNYYISKLTKEDLIGYMSYSLPIYLNNKEDIKQIPVEFSANKILKFELEMLNNIIEKSDLEINKSDLTEDDIEELLANQWDSKTEIIASTVKENYNIDSSGVKISNKSKWELTDKMISPDFAPANLKDILIYHTHTCESYTPTETYQYTAKGNFRTTDVNYNVARVGDELEKYLKKFDFNVIHDKTLHDYPSYSGSYDNSYETVSKILEENPGIELIFDIHRDAVGSDSSYAPTVKIDNEYAAQLMFVIGTNGGGLEHNNWEYNLKTAVMIQKKANEMYPGLFKPIVVRDSRYNQNLGNGASIIEVGATGNTLEQSLNSMKYLSLVLNELWKK